MEVILTQDVPTLGLAGQVLKVSAGYARNYLLPGAYALPATPNNLKTLARKREEFERRSLEAKEQAAALKKQLEGLVLVITRKSLEKGKLYGAVTPQDIVESALEGGFTLDRRKLKISDPIKSVGDYEISVRLHPEVTGAFKVKVIAEAKPEPEPAPPEPEPKRGRARRAKAGEAAEASGDAGAAPAAEGPPEKAPAPAEEAAAPKAKAGKAKGSKAKDEAKAEAKDEAKDEAKAGASAPEAAIVVDPSAAAGAPAPADASDSPPEGPKGPPAPEGEA